MLLFLAPVILISIDTLRADHLSAYGYQRIHTPNIDSFAERGAVFPKIDAQIPLTLPSHTSLFTSTYPFQNRIEENAEPVPHGAVTLAAVLKGQGYKTAAFISCVFLEKEMGLDQGFDVYDSPFHFAALSPLSGSMFLGDTRPARERRDGALVIRAATQWLTANRGQPVFAFVHLFDLHKPYERGAYDREILYVDQLLGAFKRSLVQQGLWDRSLVVLLSDHGEGLGEHGEDSHGYFIYESTLHVPLLIHWPEGIQATQAPGGLIDVAPTILDLLHIAQPASFQGRSLRSGARDVFAESRHAYDSFGWAPLRSLRSGNYKYIEAPHPELYDLAHDPGELNNIVRLKPAEAQSLRARLQKLPVGPASPAPVSERNREMLTSLGYLAPGPKSAASRADPKDRLPEFHLYEKVQVALAEHRPKEAADLLERLVRKDPGNTLARRDLGDAYMTLHNYTAARDCFQKVLGSAPTDYVSNYELGLAEEHLGQLAQALDHIQTACRIAPEAAQCQRKLEQLKSTVH